MSIIAHQGLMSISSKTPPTPPTYEYSILQNFVEGHSVGQPDTTQGDNWITQVLSEEELYDDLWCDEYYHNLVDDTVGAELIDVRKPLDFSKYGITSGTPYGMSSKNTDHDYCRLTFNVEQIYPITVETFAFARTSYLHNNIYYYSTNGPVPVFMLGNPILDGYTGYNITLEVNTWTNIVGLYIQGGWIPYEPQTLLEIDCSQDEDLHVDQANEGYDLAYWLVGWHHYALTMDNNNLYLFLDGKLKGTIPLSTECSFDVNKYEGGSFHVEHRSGTLKQMIDNMGHIIRVKTPNWNDDAFDGGFAQFAVCNQCKWTSNFVVPTEAY